MRKKIGKVFVNIENELIKLLIIIKHALKIDEWILPNVERPSGNCWWWWLEDQETTVAKWLAFACENRCRQLEMALHTTTTTIQLGYISLQHYITRNKIYMYVHLRIYWLSYCYLLTLLFYSLSVTVNHAIDCIIFACICIVYTYTHRL